MENQLSISVGSRGTLISLIDRELEILQAEKICCSRSPNPTPPQSASVPASPSAFRSSALWQDLKGLLKSPTTSHHSPSSLFCRGAIDPSQGAGAHETCHAPTLDQQRRLARQRSSNRHHHRHRPNSSQSSQAENTWWGSNMFGGKKGKKTRNALSKLVRLDREEEEDTEVPWHGGYGAEEEDDDHEFMVKPMLERFHYRCDGDSKESAPSVAGAALRVRVSNANIVDLQCCYACEASPMLKRSSFTRLSTL